MRKFFIKAGSLFISIIVIAHFTIISASAQDTYPGIPKPIVKTPDGKTVEVIPGPESTGGKTALGIHNYFFETFLPYFTKGAAGIIGALCVIFIIYGGIQYLTAYGDEEKLNTAKRTVIYSVFGLVVVMLSYAIVSIIGNLPLPEGTPQ